MWKFTKKLDFQIIAPIVIIALIGSYIGSHLIEQRIVKHIEIGTKKELENVANEIYFISESNYRALFNQYGADRESFKKLESIVRKETVETLNLMLNEYEHYEAYIQNGEGIYSITGDETVFTETDEQHSILSKIPLQAEGGKYSTGASTFYYTTREFLPWHWKIIVLDDFRRHSQLLNDNVQMVFTTVAVIVGSIIAFLLILFYYGIKKPFRVIDRQLSAIQSGDYGKNTLQASMEVEKIISSLNLTADMIHNREAQILDQLDYTNSILNAQASIVLIVGEDHGLLQANEQLFKFFPTLNGLEDFRREHSCICECFDVMDEADYIGPPKDKKTYWVEPVIRNPNHDWKVAMTSDGIQHYFSVLANRVQHRGSRRDIIVLSDITEAENYRRDLEKRVREQLEKNREKDRYIMEQERRYATTELLSNIAHQWRQPLNTISINLAQISDMLYEAEVSGEKVYELLEKSTSSVQNLSKVINLFTQYEQSRDRERCFNLGECYAQLTELLLPYLKDKRVAFICPDKSDVVLNGNLYSLTETITKIINNMVRVFEDKKIDDPVIRITEHAKDGKVIIYVSDNLGGIPEEILPIIFDPYTTTEFKSQGKGLGLYIAKSIIENSFKGDIFAENTQDGARFIIQLPLMETKATG